MYAQNPRENASPKQKIPATILLVFSLAGLIAGFAFGGFTGHKAPPTTSNIGPTKTPTTIARSTVTVTPTTQPVVALNPPNTTNLSAATQHPDGVTSYSITIQAIDKNKNPIHAPNITCKLWLVQRIPSGKILQIDPTVLKAYNNLSTTPIQGTISTTNQPDPEIASSLNFAATTPQTAPCNAQGQMTWSYTIAATVPPGDYDLVFLTDWQGIHFNWGWADITIQ